MDIFHLIFGLILIGVGILYQIYPNHYLWLRWGWNKKDSEKYWENQTKLSKIINRALYSLFIIFGITYIFLSLF